MPLEFSSWFWKVAVSTLAVSASLIFLWLKRRKAIVETANRLRQRPNRSEAELVQTSAVEMTGRNDGGTETETNSTAESSSAPDQNAAVQALLQHCREGLEKNDRDQALASLLHIIRITRGEEAITGFLDEAKLRAEREAQERARREEMRQAVEDEALAAAQRMAQELVEDESTLLSQRGKTNIIQEAFENGSSVVCRECNALVPRARYDQHRDYWCEAREHSDHSDSE